MKIASYYDYVLFQPTWCPFELLLSSYFLTLLSTTEYVFKRKKTFQAWWALPKNKMKTSKIYQCPKDDHIHLKIIRTDSYRSCILTQNPHIYYVKTIVVTIDFACIFVPGDPRKCDELVFFNNFKSSYDITKLMVGKEAVFYKICSDTNYLKILPLVTTPRLD